MTSSSPKSDVNPTEKYLLKESDADLISDVYHSNLDSEIHCRQIKMSLLWLGKKGVEEKKMLKSHSGKKREAFGSCNSCSLRKVHLT